ncbi:MAG: YciI family protein [Hyphomicrobiales bacterium]
MIYAVLFTDNAEHAEARQRLMPAHLDFLEQEKECIRAAGPLREADGGAAGGLWLVEAESREAVEELCRKDPLWSTGLRRSVRVLEWAQVFTDGRRLI